jgi:hypothetical protein
MKFNAFFQAGIITVFIFLAGIMFGVFIDNFRLSEIREGLSKVEVNSNDALLLSLYFQKLGKESCNMALDANLKFNDKIYNEGLSIENSINANKFTPELEQEWRRYILMQTQFWLNSIELKKNCNFNYSNVVHLFNLKDGSPQAIANKRLQSGIMLSLKEKCGNKIMLIPLTADTDLSVVDAIVNRYNITTFPAVIINEQKVFQGLTGLEQLNQITKC